MTAEQRMELESVVKIGYDGSVSDRAQMILWRSDGLGVAEIAERAGTSKPTVYKWLDRYSRGGLEALTDLKSTGRPREVDERSRARILALTRYSPPAETGLTHWSSYEMAKYLKQHEGIVVSHNFVAGLWREHGLKPHRQGAFKLSRDPELASKVADIVGLYLDPPRGAVVLSMTFDKDRAAHPRLQTPRHHQPLRSAECADWEGRLDGVSIASAPKSS